MLGFIYNTMNEKLFYQFIGNKIKMFRKLRKLTQKELGEKVDLTRVSITNIERNKHKPTLHLIVDISRKLNIPYELLLPMNNEHETGTNYLIQRVENSNYSNESKKGLI